MPTHDCPIDGCQAQVAPSQLMCRNHWALVPGDIGREVYHQYKRAPQSIPHLEACARAVKAVEVALARRHAPTAS